MLEWIDEKQLIKCRRNWKRIVSRFDEFWKESTKLNQVRQKGEIVYWNLVVCVSDQHKIKIWTKTLADPDRPVSFDLKPTIIYLLQGKPWCDHQSCRCAAPSFHFCGGDRNKHTHTRTHTHAHPTTSADLGKNQPTTKCGCQTTLLIQTNLV